MLEFKNVSYGWDERHFLQNNLNLKFEERKIYVILGPNGCGKSTFIQLLQNRNVFYKGEILLNQKNLNTFSVNQIARNLICVGQNNDQCINMKVLDFIVTGFYPYLNIFQSPADKHLNEAMRIMESLKIEEWSSRTIASLSGGEFKQVLLARCLTGSRKIILLDELELALDYANQIKFTRTVRQLQESGKCIILISHNPNLALALKSQVLMFGKDLPYLFGDSEGIVTRENLRKYFNIEVIETCNEEHGLVQFVPQ